jgi:dimethylargininase
MPTLKVALTREVSAAIARCELTHLARARIDVNLARAQHAAYERALADAGYRVERVPASRDMPDSVFIEDTAVVVDELAVMTRPGAESRRAEIADVANALQHYRTVVAVEAPGTLDGGDVLTVGKAVFVGVSSRTNRDGIAQLRTHLAPHGYTVGEVTVSGCLHLKSAATAAADDVVVVNPKWIPRDAFGQFERIEIDPHESMAANVVRLADRLIVAAAFPRTAERLTARGYHVVAVDASELAKAEGAVTCCSILVEDQS